MADGSIRRVVLGGHEFYILVAEAEIVERFLNEIGILVADVAELGGGDANEQNFVAGVAVAGGLEPGVVGVAVNFLFQGVKDAGPGIRNDVGTRERHFLPEILKSAGEKTSGKTNLRI